MSIAFDVGVSRAEFGDCGVTPPLLELVVVRSRSQRIAQPNPEDYPLDLRRALRAWLDEAADDLPAGVGGGL